MHAHKHRLLKYFALSCLLIFGQLQTYTYTSAAPIETFTALTDSFNFSLPGLKDDLHSLSDYRGRVVLVNFWASWCPPCIHEMPVLKKLKQDLADKPFEILAINVGEKKYKVRKFANLIKLELPVLLDTDNHTFNQWGVKTLPTSFLVDTTGVVRYRVRGNPGWDSAETMDMINKLISERQNITNE